MNNCIILHPFYTQKELNQTKPVSNEEHRLSVLTSSYSKCPPVLVHKSHFGLVLKVTQVNYSFNSDSWKVSDKFVRPN